MRPSKPRPRELRHSKVSKSSAHFEATVLGSGHQETGIGNGSRVLLDSKYFSKVKTFLFVFKSSTISFQLDTVKMEVLLRNFDLVIDNGWNSIS